MRKFTNPFNYIAGWTSLLAGAAALAASAVTASLTGQSFDGFMHIGFAGISIWQALVQQIVTWLIFASLLYAAALAASHSAVRALDIYGTNLFARLPIFPMLAAAPLLGLDLERLSDPAAVGEIITANPAPVAIYGTIVLALAVCFYWWSYKAFSVSANLKGAKAVAIFIACYIVTEIASGPLLRFMNALMR